MNLAAIRRMAAKKGTQIQFQTDVVNDEEWDKLLEKIGLIVIDVYSDWCGPCTAMVSSLKKLKLEIGSDYLHFSVAKSSNVSVLERFQNKSEPTWIFVAGGQLVNLMFGVDAPALIRLIKEELERETKVLEQKMERKWIPFSELTPAEKDRDAAIAKKNQEKLKAEEQKLAQKMNVMRERSLMKLANMIPTHSCMIYFPHMIAADGSCAVAQKMMYLNDSISVAVVDQISVQLNQTSVEKSSSVVRDKSQQRKREIVKTGELFTDEPDSLDAMQCVFFKCPVFENFNESINEILSQKPSLVTLLQTIITDEGSEVTSPRPTKTDYERFMSIEQKLTKMVYGYENAVCFTEQSVAYEFITENESGGKLPPMWTPVSTLSKAAAVEVLFPRKVESIGYIPEKLPPPQLIIIYDANKVIDLLDLMKIYRNEIHRIGFFDSVDPCNAKLICKTYDQFAKLTDDQVKNAKVIIALKKGDTEDLLFEFSQVIPLYISPNEKVGTEESEKFFPYDYNDDEEIKADEDELDGGTDDIDKNFLHVEST